MTANSPGNPAKNSPLKVQVHSHPFLEECCGPEPAIYPRKKPNSNYQNREESLIAVPKFPKPIENSDRAPELRSPLGLWVNQPHSSEKYLAATEGLAGSIDFAPFAWKPAAVAKLALFLLWDLAARECKQGEKCLGHRFWGVDRSLAAKHFPQLAPEG